MKKLMPLYICHKEVRALKILSVREGGKAPWTHHLVFEDKTFEPCPVTAEWVKRFEPQPGGYLVEYKDGYLSYSPAKAFEEGYTRVVKP